MASVFDRKLLVVTGKGGVGKTTLAAALGLLAAERGLRTIVVEVGEQSRLQRLFGAAAPGADAEHGAGAAPGAGAEHGAGPEHGAGAEHELQDRLWNLSLDPDQALLEWLQSLGGRVSGRVLASSSTFQYFAAAAPGARELVSMVKVWELTQARRWRGRRGGYDLVVLDAPATGHALGMLGAPRTFGAIARVGPIASQAQKLEELLKDEARCDYLAVAHGTELAVTETLGLQQRLREQLGRELRAVIVNGLLPQRFNSEELGKLAELATAQPAGETHEQRAIGAALAAARAVSGRARSQHNQLARLRRRGIEAFSIPFQFSAELDLDAVRRIAGQLKSKL
jgi:energy-coupling factor transporter ATP-binding protein EcfA2